ncbi:MAG: hypothetical protein SCL54_05155 [Bacillota bacterium]|nr:hypothetical protein [Bacillota bacterium]
MSNVYENKKKIDLLVGSIFGIATIVFIILFFTNDSFFMWAFDRHHNILSWYIRPVFIIPIVFFAYKRSLTGVMVSIFSLFTSMFWFPVPATVSPEIIEFLSFEQEYLKGSWDASKIFIQLSVPLFFIALIFAAWRRSWKYVLVVMIAAAVLKMLWSAIFAGDSGLSIIKPAITGLVVCIGVVYYFMRKKKQKK